MLMIGLSVVSAPSCKKEDETKPQSNSINKILPLGASRVEGNRPEFESYRYELWKNLTHDDWTFDFIGTATDEGSYPDVGTDSFDPDHEGRGGFTSGEILSGLGDWLDDTGAPDIVLFSSPGGNDALQGLDYAMILANINAIIDTLQAVNPNVQILIEQMAPALSTEMTPELTTYFTNLQSDVVSLATDQSTSTSTIIPVDMYSNFTDSMLADDVHYNELGASFVAAQYYNTLIHVMEE